MFIKNIRKLLAAELAATDEFIISQLNSAIPLVQELVAYIVNCGGKRIRPILLWLVAKACQNSSEQVTHLAAVIELIHTATLLHDDVVDHASLRRGYKTANTIWGNEASVLIGDFLYSRTFQIVVNLNNKSILEIFADATHYIAEGEILQLVNAHNPDHTEELYFAIIQRKTAKLFAVAAQIAVISGLSANQSLTHEVVIAMEQYGFNLGIAYQLVDDLLDYSDNHELTGKNIGNDLAEGKATLPIIHALSHAPAAEVKILQHAIKIGGGDNLAQIAHIIAHNGGIDYTISMAKKYAGMARDNIRILPVSPYRQALDDLAKFVINQYNHT